ncbi:MAG TPA: TatD family hydrolase [Pirellulaceae bacterium]|nr:TatD family hydrolase [Pirellulaceae bacterium]HMO91915.1 TatD family hydrolase [Pirellulaceae bacterium]HMP68715.1 TatD family hydrolase [Pirellulaceae bacterium]
MHKLFSCIDIGANLTHKSFARDFDNVVRAAVAVGVEKLVLTGASISSSQEANTLCRKFPGVLYSTVGIHPHEASTFNVETAEKLAEMLRLPQVVAVGECGLDFNRDFSPRDKQCVCFRGHLELAAQTKLPLFLHDREAFSTFYPMIKEFRDSIGDAVVHCFTGAKSELSAYLDADLHIGITGWICDERRGTHLREIVKYIPTNRLMIETDAPYLAPRDLRPKIHRNEPKYLPHILHTVAHCRGDSVEVLAGQIYATTCRFFGFEPCQTSSGENSVT